MIFVLHLPWESSMERRKRTVALLRSYYSCLTCRYRPGLKRKTCQPTLRPTRTSESFYLTKRSPSKVESKAIYARSEICLRVTYANPTYT